MSIKGIYDRIKGVERLRLTGAFPESFLNACAINGYELWEMEIIDSITLSFYSYEQDREALNAIAAKSGCELELISLSGGSSDRKKLKKRMRLLVLLAAAVCLCFASSLFVWDVDIIGDGELNRGKVERALENAGVAAGTYWPGIDSDLVRSKVLLEMPELSWMTVNVSGSRATVLLRQRREIPELYNSAEPADILSRKTGVVRNVTALNGMSCVVPGQVVTKGETLISAAIPSPTDGTRQVRAKGEVIAETWPSMTVVCPESVRLRTGRGPGRSRFAIKLGNYRINMYFSTGKAIDECDKIINNFNVGFSGLFSTPVTFIHERLTPVRAEAGPYRDEDGIEDRLLEQMIQDTRGEILEYDFSTVEREGLLYVTLRAHCLEDIAELREADK